MQELSRKYIFVIKGDKGAPKKGQRYFKERFIVEFVAKDCIEAEIKLEEALGKKPQIVKIICRKTLFDGKIEQINDTIIKG